MFEPSPCYAWNNTLNGAKLNMVLRPWADPKKTAQQAAHVKEGRDFFNEEPKPEYYKPYIYPHPLQGKRHGDELLRWAPRGESPFPTVAKRRFVQTIRLRPSRTRMQPRTGRAMFQGNEGQPTPLKDRIVAGTTTVTVPGSGRIACSCFLAFIGLSDFSRLHPAASRRKTHDLNAPFRLFAMPLALPRIILGNLL